MSVAIEARDLRKAWGDTTAVDGINFTAPSGAFTVLLGPSGCGKSTTLRLIAGLEEASDGAVLIDGADVTRRPPNDRQISMVFQSYALFPHLSVAENILFGLKVRRVPAAERAERLARVAGLLGLTHLLDRRPSQISGGQQQRVALGRAIIAEKPICLMDEPLSNLDAKLRHEMRVELKALQRKLGITMVYVTHDQVEAIAMADRIIVMNGGRIEQNADPRTLYDRPASTFVARFIGTPPMNILDLAPSERGWTIAGGGTVVAPASDDLPGAMQLGVRPEDIALADAGGVPAIVEQVEYLGADLLVDCRIAGQALVARAATRHPVSAGQTVNLVWAADSQHLFDAATGVRIAAAPGFPDRTVTSRPAGQ
ncbi:ABC transporter ATP-binding protein [Thalassobaculum sp. OXR-137]|uniref:ABC transporter ATP-binding protein n=1 Tax=Thalassobaculum sp. OXR-137 TaxID=3100173 RepID=UPI002AC91FF3|nr:ABC transporter ATP-binding protein [Thalassobaculum sp. OXR-137]WPZ34547.1 ABC transporter ATP-binding protein [Thalassobaculum sp. OXR-137]